tara:strand:- start:263 stop:508 length:246 start_codon:yes stop_codon:yes gene_type:complete
MSNAATTKTHTVELDQTEVDLLVWALCLDLSRLDRAAARASEAYNNGPADRAKATRVRDSRRAKVRAATALIERLEEIATV